MHFRYSAAEDSRIVIYMALFVVPQIMLRYMVPGITTCPPLCTAWQFNSVPTGVRAELLFAFSCLHFRACVVYFEEWSTSTFSLYTKSQNDKQTIICIFHQNPECLQYRVVPICRPREAAVHLPGGIHTP